MRSTLLFIILIELIAPSLAQAIAVVTCNEFHSYSEEGLHEYAVRYEPDNQNLYAFAAAAVGDHATMDQLKRRGASFSAAVEVDGFSLTPLAIAAWCGHTKILQRLIAMRISPNQTASGTFFSAVRISLTPLSLAILGPEYHGGNAAAVELLLEGGAAITTAVATEGIDDYALAARYSDGSTIKVLATYRRTHRSADVDAGQQGWSWAGLVYSFDLD